MKELNVTIWDNRYTDSFKKGMLEILEKDYNDTLVYEKEKLIGVVRHKQDDLYTMEQLNVIEIIDRANIIRQVNTEGYSFLVCVVDAK